MSGQESTFNCVPCDNMKCQYCLTAASTCTQCFGAHRDLANGCVCLPGYRDVFVAGNAATYDCVRCSDSPCEKCDASESVCTQCFGSNRELAHGCACPAGYRNYFE